MADRAQAQALADRLTGKSDGQGDRDAIDTIVQGIMPGKGEHPNAKREPGDGQHELEEDELLALAENGHDRRPTSGETDDEDDDEDLDDLDDEDEEDEDEDDLDDDTDEEDDEDEDGEEDDEDEDDDADVVDYDDNDLVEVVVEGETQRVSLRDLKAAYSGEGAIDKRLKDATEERKAARAERQAGLTEVNTYRTNLAQTIEKIGGLLFAPIIDPPDPKLRASNMNEYLMQDDAYKEDQARISEGQQALMQALQEETKTSASQRAELRKKENDLLIKAMPELADAKKAPIIQKQIMSAAAHYGFTPQQVAQVDQHELFLMARDAGRWLNLQKLKEEGRGKRPTGGDTQKRKRKLRAGNGSSTTARKAAVAKSAKEKAALTKKARQTGSVDDVTAMIVAGAKSRKGSRNGRRSANV